MTTVVGAGIARSSLPKRNGAIGKIRAEANDHPEAGVAYAQRTTATASWQRSVLIIAALSAVAWAAVILIVIGALSTL